MPKTRFITKSRWKAGKWLLSRAYPSVGNRLIEGQKCQSGVETQSMILTVRTKVKEKMSLLYLPPQKKKYTGPSLPLSSIQLSNRHSCRKFWLGFVGRIKHRTVPVTIKKQTIYLRISRPSLSESQISLEWTWAKRTLKGSTEDAR